LSIDKLVWGLGETSTDGVLHGTKETMKPGKKKGEDGVKSPVSLLKWLKSFWWKKIAHYSHPGLPNKGAGGGVRFPG